MMKLAIYNENCTMAGRVAAREAEIDDYREQHDGQDCDDWTIYAGSREELIDLAQHMLAKAPTGAAGSYQRRAAQAILDELARG
jgi:hypothetical protein